MSVMNKQPNILKPFTIHSQHPGYPETTQQTFHVLIIFKLFFFKAFCYNNTDCKAVIIPILRPDKLTEPITFDKLYWGLNWASNVASIPSTTAVHSTVVCPYFLIAKIFTASFDLNT